MQRLQEALLLYDAARLPEELPQGLREAASCLIEARLFDALQAPAARALLGQEAPPHVPAAAEEQLPLLLLGAACLQLFVQLNWTGPDLPAADVAALGLEVEDPKECAEALWVDGGDRVHTTSTRALPALLQARRLLLPLADKAAPGLFLAPWWALRTLRAHQAFLADRAPALLDERVRLMGIVEEMVNAAPQALPRQIITEMHAEFGLAHLEYRRAEPGKAQLLRAKEVSGLQVELTGVLGKRTKYQLAETSQLLLKARSAPAEEGSGRAAAAEAMPAVVPHAEDISLLENPKLEASVEEEEAKARLALEDQVLLLGLFLVVKTDSPYNEPLAIEELSAFVRRVGQECANWLVHSTFLLQRARLESSVHKTAERAALQVQSLVDQWADAEPHAAERLRYCHALAYPPRRLLKRELGLMFLRLGVAASARDLFLELEMWAELVQSYVVMQDMKRARQLLLDRIAVEETPELWCILGDVTGEDNHFRRSWELSGRRYAKAQRFLGKSLVRQERWAEAVAAFDLSLALNPLHPDAWFSLGCSHMRLEQWPGAVTAFRRVIQQRSEDGESYSNLGAACLRLGKTEEAFSAFQQGLKHCRENWKMWENFLKVSLETRRIFEAIEALRKLVELRREKAPISTMVQLARFVAGQLAAAKIEPRCTLHALLERLLQEAGAVVAGNPEVWEAQAVLKAALGEDAEALELHNKQVRQMMAALDWQHSEEDLGRLVTAEEGAAELQQRLGSKKALYSARLHLRGVVRKAQENMAGGAAFARLEDTLARVTAAEKEAANP